MTKNLYFLKNIRIKTNDECYGLRAMGYGLWVMGCVLCAVYCMIFVGLTNASAADLTVTPAIIDETAYARDILKYEVTLTNGSNRKLDIYAAVNDLSPTEGRQEFISPSQLDKETSLARWVRVQRGVIELQAGASTTIPLNVEVDMKAAPGKRHAAVSFVPASNGYDAQAAALKGGGSQVLLNIDINENIIDKAQITEWRSGRNVYLSLPVSLNFTISNFGNQTITPTGKIYIYNRQNQEVAQLNVDTAGQPIEPAQEGEYAYEWVPEKALGKYKARIELTYGNGGERDLMDTTYFWVMPLKLLIGFLGAIILLVVLLSIIIYKRSFHSQQAVLPAAKVEQSGVINLKADK